MTDNTKPIEPNFTQDEYDRFVSLASNIDEYNLLDKVISLEAENAKLKKLDENVKEWIDELKKSKGLIFGSRKYLQKILESLYE